MSTPGDPPFRMAIACGGTGGHLFPGLALASEFRQRGGAVTLLISEKDVDQKAVAGVRGVDILTLPSVGLTRGGKLAFAWGFFKSLRTVNARFRQEPPDAVIGMGGFTSAPAVIGGRFCGARTFLHESNSIPGRANRFLARLATGVFVGFPSAAGRLRCQQVVVSGTPVRSGFGRTDSAACREFLGFDSGRPVILVTGGSQGASGLNQLVFDALPILSGAAPELQWLHLSGPRDCEKAREVYRALGLRARVEPFLSSMEEALAAATLAISRAGASSISEMVAARLPAVLIPFPAATDNHQFFNALALQRSSAARLLEQRSTSPAQLAEVVLAIYRKPDLQQQMRQALAEWHHPEAARTIAEAVLQLTAENRPSRKRALRHSLDHGTSLA